MAQSGRKENMKHGLVVKGLWNCRNEGLENSGVVTHDALVLSSIDATLESMPGRCLGVAYAIRVEC